MKTEYIFYVASVSLAFLLLIGTFITIRRIKLPLPLPRSLARLLWAAGLLCFTLVLAIQSLKSIAIHKAQPILIGIELFSLLTALVFIVFLRRSMPNRKTNPRKYTSLANFQQTLIRISVNSSILAILLLLPLVFFSQQPPNVERWVYLLIVMSLTFTFLIPYLPLNPDKSALLFRSWLLLAIVFMIVIIAITGGVSSHYSLFFIPVIILSAATYSLPATMTVSFLISLLYVADVLWPLSVADRAATVNGVTLSVIIYLGVAWIAGYLFKEIRHQAVQRETYESISKDLTAKVAQFRALDELSSLGSPDLDTTLSHTLRTALRVFFCQIGAVYLWDAEKECLKIAAHQGFVPETYEVPLSEKGIKLWIEAASKPIYSEAADLENLHISELGVSGADIVIIMPLVTGRQLLGCLSMAHARNRVWTHDELAFLALLCERMSIALDKARLYDETVKSAAEALTLFETASNMSSLQSIPSALHYAASRLVELTGTDNCLVLARHSSADFELIMSTHQPYDIGQCAAALAPAEQSFSSGTVVTCNLPVPTGDDTQSAFRSLIALPVFSNEEIYCVLLAHTSMRNRHYDTRTVKMAEAIAHVVGIALNNLRLVDHMNLQISRLTALSYISASINTMLHLEDTLSIIVSSVARIMQKESALLALFNRDQHLELRAYYNISDQLQKSFLLPPNEGLTKAVLEDRQPHYCRNYAREVSPANPVLIEEGVRFAMAVPLFTNISTPLGILYIGDHDEHVPDEEEITLASMLATQASIAITNAELYENLNKQLNIFTSLQEVSSGISGSPPHKSPEFLVHKTAEILQAEYCGLLTFDSEKQLFMNHTSIYCSGDGQDLPPYAFRMPGPESVYAESSSKRTPLLFSNLQAHMAKYGFPIPEVPFRDLLCVQIGPEESPGTLLFAANKKGGLFGGEDLDLITLIANLVTAFLENIRLFEELQLQVRNLGDLMDVANAIQGSLELRDILDVIVDKIHLRFQASTSQITLRHIQDKKVVIAAHRGFSAQQIRSDTYHFECPLIDQTAEADYGSCPGSPICPRAELKIAGSYMCTPIWVDDKMTGVIHVTRQDENIFSNQDIILLHSFALETSLALQRGQLFTAVADEKAKIEAMVQSIEDPLAYLDLDARVRMVNGAFMDYFHLQKEAILEHTLEDISTASPLHISMGWDALDEIIREVLDMGVKAATTFHFVGTDTSYYAHVTVTPLTDSRGFIAGAIALFHDITPMQHLLEQLELEKIRAEESNRLKTQFLANISHELRTPLNSIIGYTQCIIDGLDGPVNLEQQRDLEQVIGGAENLLRLINDILDLSKVEAGKMELVMERTSAGTIIREILSVMNPVAEARLICLATDVSDSLPELVTDAFRLKQILINLVTNAIKFTEQGTILVGAFQSVEADCCTFFVQDSGIGIDEESRQYIFDEFRQADGSTTRRYGGSGLGLSISRRLVVLLGGNIWFESEKNIGTTFYFTIPFQPTLSAAESPSVNFFGQ